MNDAPPSDDRGLGQPACRPYGATGPSSEGAHSCPVDLDVSRCPAFRRGYRIYEVAAMYDVDRKTVSGWISRGWLRARQMGKRLKLVLRKDLEDFERRRARV